jgi:hypothetical protein
VRQPLLHPALLWEERLGRRADLYAFCGGDALTKCGVGGGRG